MKQNTKEATDGFSQEEQLQHVESYSVNISSEVDIAGTTKEANDRLAQEEHCNMWSCTVQTLVQR
jgi:hypothetical protein